MVTTDNLEVLESEIRGVAADIAEIKHVLKNVQHSQTLAAERLVRTEVQYDNHTQALTRAFNELKDHDGRIKELEVQQPMTKWARNLLLTGITAVVGTLGVGAFTINRVVERPVSVVITKDAINAVKDKQE